MASDQRPFVNSLALSTHVLARPSYQSNANVSVWKARLVWEYETSSREQDLFSRISYIQLTSAPTHWQKVGIGFLFRNLF